MRLLIFCAALCVQATFSGAQPVINQINFNKSIPGDIVISEIMCDPDPPNGLPDGEYVEIYNRGNVAVDLTGYEFNDGSSKFLPTVTILPGEYVIICHVSDTTLFSLYGKVAFVSSISLTNSGEKIAIRDPSGNAVDSVTYSDGWFGNSYKKDGGWSLEKVDPGYDCPIAENWKPSEDPNGGTPGSINSVYGAITDNEPPLLLRAFCPDSVSVTLVFNEPMDAASLMNLANYNCVTPGMPVNAAIADNENKRVTLLFSNEIPLDKTCLMNISNVSDCGGNLIYQNTNIRFGRTINLNFQGIVINEILFNPNETGADFIELYHNGNSIIDLSHLKIVSFSLENLQPITVTPFPEEPWLFFPGEYVVLTEGPLLVDHDYRSTYPLQFVPLNGLPSMNVDEGHIGISYGNEIIDQVYYNEDFHFDLIEDVKGISLEKIHPGRNAMSPGSWHSAAPSAGFATPGYKNSQFIETPTEKSDVVTLFPELFSPDYDGIDDIITFTIKTGVPGYISNLRIYNATGHMIYSLACNSPIATVDQLTWNGIDDDGNRAAVGIYVAILEVFNLDGDVKHYKLPFVLAVKN